MLLYILLFYNCLIPVSPGQIFAKYGESLDTTIPKNDDGCSAKQKLPSVFNFFGTEFDSFWICTNGIISFSGPISEYSPAKFPLSNVSMIAAFWADVDTTPGGAGRNEIFWRVDTKSDTLDNISKFVKDHTPDLTFKPHWSIVATWHNVGYFEKGTDLLNTFQIVLSCENAGSCYCFLSYQNIQWTQTHSHSEHTHAQGGFNHANGNFTLLPGSRTASIRNLISSSNIGKDGLFLYRISHNAVDKNVGCKPQVFPKMAHMYFEPTKFELKGFLCDQNLSPKVVNAEVVFVGSSYEISVMGFISNDRQTITGRFPFWGVAEEIRVYPKVKELTIKHSVMMQFVTSGQILLSRSGKTRLLNSKLLNENLRTGVVDVSLTWDKNFWASSSVSETDEVLVMVHTVKVNLLPVHRELKLRISSRKIETVKNNGTATVSFELSEGLTFIHLDTTPQDSEAWSSCFSSHWADKSMLFCTSHPLIALDPIALKSTSSDCRDQLHRMPASKTWYEELGKWYGCPTNSRLASIEVQSGLNGWEYDPCCASNSNVKPSSFCNKTCEMNKGASFCIQSMGLKIEEKIENSSQKVTVSNQCCYDRRGTLITDPNKGAGRAKRSVNNPENEMVFFEHEYSLWISCCVSEPGSCYLYNQVRPVVIGRYIPRRIKINWGDPHIETLDGFQYTFNGLGVYTMVEVLTINLEEVELEMQISTRTLGRGTVFSGFSIKDDATSLEVFMKQDKTLLASINNTDIQLATMGSNVEIGGVKIWRRGSNSQFRLQQSDFVVEALVNTGVLNLAVSPSLRTQGRLRGLLGNFDSNSQNDLVRKDGVLIASDSNLSTIHDNFGETWKVSRENWLFGLETRKLIDKDMEDITYQPVYEAVFESEQLRVQAEQVCAGSNQCLLDVALTGNLEMAENAKSISEAREQTRILDQNFQSNKHLLSSSDSAIEWVKENIYVIIFSLLAAFLSACLFLRRFH